MAEARLLKTLQHPTTGRWAIVEDYGTSAWLLVTEPNSQKPVGDCFIYNCQPPEGELPSSCDRTSPPPIVRKYASDAASHPGVSADRIRLAWTRSGNAVLVLLDETPFAFLVAGEKRGFSRGVAVEGPYGHPWSEERFLEVFQEKCLTKENDPDVV
jgi:hypothetical protein